MFKLSPLLLAFSLLSPVKALAQPAVPAPASLPSVDLPRELDRVLRDHQREWQARSASGPWRIAADMNNGNSCRCRDEGVSPQLRSFARITLRVGTDILRNSMASVEELRSPLIILLLNRFTTLDALSDDRIIDIIPDKSGNIRVATRNGLNRFRPAPFDVLSSRTGLATNLPGGMVRDAAGTLWLAAARRGPSAFWAMHDLMFEHQNALDDVSLAR